MIDTAFIVSAGRSGSTLLDRLVGAHPQALAVGEVRHLPKNIALDSICSCASAVSQCAFWRPVVDHLGERLGADLWSDPYRLDLGYIQAAVEIDRRRQTRLYTARRAVALRWIETGLRLGLDVRRSPWLASYRRALQANALLHEVLRERSGRRIVVDSTKGFRWSVGQYLFDPGRSRILLLSRDGRGVVASLMRSGRTREQAVRQWMQYYQRALPWIERHVDPAHVLHVRYEELATSTDETLRRVFGFLGLPPLPLHEIAHAPTAHILNGNPMRHGSALEIRPDERWRGELTAEDVAYVQRTCEPVARRLGYAGGAAE